MTHAEKCAVVDANDLGLVAEDLHVILAKSLQILSTSCPLYSLVFTSSTRKHQGSTVPW